MNNCPKCNNLITLFPDSRKNDPSDDEAAAKFIAESKDDLSKEIIKEWGKGEINSSQIKDMSNFQRDKGAIPAILTADCPIYMKTYLICPACKSVLRPIYSQTVYFFN